LGASFLDVTARQSASARVAMHGTRVVAPGSSRPLVAVTLAGTAQGCADISGNELVGSASVAPMAVNVPACR
jgi:hypothetical protein